jgi:hypothetical protein
MDSDFKIYVITFVAAMCSIGYILPDLFSGLEDLENQTNIIVATRIDTRELHSRARKETYEEVLVVLLDNGGELRFTNGDHWNEIQRPDYIGKPIKFYKNDRHSGYDPVQVEIDNKIIYKKNDDWKATCFFLLLTIGCLIYSVNSIRKRLTT